MARPSPAAGRRPLAAAALLLILLSATPAPAAYTPATPELLRPPLLLPFVTRSLDTYLGALDPLHGGFFMLVGRDGTVLADTKSQLTQSRHAYGFTRGFLLTGDPKYLDAVRSALDFQYAHAWDGVNEGWHRILARRDGSELLTSQLNSPGYPWTWLGPNSQKWSFMQHYLLLGPLAAAEVEQRPVDWEWFHRGVDVNERKLWDARPGFEGYYESASYTWSNPSGKGFTASVDAVTTHALAAYLTTGSQQSRDRLVQLGNILRDRLAAHVGSPGVLVGFPESYNSNWTLTTASGGVSVGHVIKTAWCLNRIYLVTGDASYLEAARRIFDHVWNHTSPHPLYDREYGAPYMSFNWATGAAQDGTDKDWWMTEQAILGGLIHHYTTGEDAPLEMADGSLSFFLRKMGDPLHGDVAGSTDRLGTWLDDRKGHEWKASYHSIETAYFAYLYASTYLYAHPVSLHYRFTPEAPDRTLLLRPFAIQDGALRIRSVTRDGTPYTAFNPAALTLHLPPGTSGTFRVTFSVNGARPFQNLFHVRRGIDRGWAADWLGSVFVDTAFHPWMYHSEHGWLYAYGTDAGSLWLWCARDGRFYYTSDTLYPLLYSPTDGSWLYYAFDAGNGNRRFFNYHTGSWFTRY